MEPAAGSDPVTDQEACRCLRDPQIQQRCQGTASQNRGTVRCLTLSSIQENIHNYVHTVATEVSNVQY